MIINLVSFHLWDDDYRWKERLNWFITNVVMGKPDILCLQGVSKRMLIVLVPTFLKLGYKYILNTVERGTFELIATLWQIGDWKFNRYSTSELGKGLLWCNLTIHGKTIGVATSELDLTKFEMGQLTCSLKYLGEKFETCLFAISGKLEKKFPSEWKDLWKSCGENKFYETTLDCKRNDNLYSKEEFRGDRILYKGKFNPISFNLIGTDKVCSGSNPSTHFGIQSSIVY